MDEVWMKICSFVLVAGFLQEVTALSLRNERLGTCVQVQENDNNRIILQECKPGSALQEWHWSPETRLLRNPYTQKCLTALKVQDQGSVGLWLCTAKVEDSQAWICSKKGHLTLHGKGYHLSVHHESSEIFLSKERMKSAKWRTMRERTVCEESQNELDITGQRIVTKSYPWQLNPDLISPKTVQSATFTTAVPQLNSSVQSEEPGPSVNAFSMEHGIEWKVTMLVLSSLILFLGIVILTLNIYQHRRKKTVVVLKSYSSIDEASQPGSPVSGERAPLTKHPVKPPRSPSIQRGEILVEWKDGTVTPLFDTYLTS